MTAPLRRVLVVDDDDDIRLLLEELLRGAGYGVHTAKDGRDALRTFHANPTDLVVLDLSMPELDGFETLERLRDLSDVPVILLTARGGEIDKVRGFRGGADDYVVKPVDLDELGARLRALVRRAHGVAQDKLRVGAIELDPAARTVRCRGQLVTLAAREFDLLHALMLNAGRVMSREQLEQHLYSWGQEVGSNAIEVHVHHLRRKLGTPAIRTVRGIGYTLSRESS